METISSDHESAGIMSRAFMSGAHCQLGGYFVIANNSCCYLPKANVLTCHEMQFNESKRQKHGTKGMEEFHNPLRVI